MDTDRDFWAFVRDFFRVPRQAGSDNHRMTEVRCGGCGLVFTVPTLFTEDKARRDRAFFCPNGHRIKIKATA